VHSAAHGRLPGTAVAGLPAAREVLLLRGIFVASWGPGIAGRDSHEHPLTAVASTSNPAVANTAIANKWSCKRLRS
jgi:hypothetical protein